MPPVPGAAGPASSLMRRPVRAPGDPAARPNHAQQPQRAAVDQHLPWPRPRLLRRHHRQPFSLQPCQQLRQSDQLRMRRRPAAALGDQGALRRLQPCQEVVRADRQPLHPCNGDPILRLHYAAQPIFHLPRGPKPNPSPQRCDRVGCLPQHRRLNARHIHPLFVPKLSAGKDCVDGRITFAPLVDGRAFRPAAGRRRRLPVAHGG